VTGTLPAALVAPAKLTLSLRIVGVREDGMHLVDAEMVELDLFDTLWLHHGDGLVVDGPAAPPGGLGPDDLVTRALRMVDRHAAVHLHKRIPAGAGLGGGSADAAAILKWAGKADPLRAVQLGADVAFSVVGGRARVSGIGEVVEPLEYQRETFTLLTPPIHCSTPAVYRAWDELGGPEDPSGNDLTPAALAVHPELTRWRDLLGERSGMEPRLAGSGSTWFVPGAHHGDHMVVVETVPPGWTPGERPG
jgi:4-diphosphocytidyl-2-C-methyl-D-erythritol kinase